MTTEEKQAQRMSALRAGNRVRLYRANVKRDVARGAMRPELPFAQQDETLAGMAVEELLLAVPGLGPARVLQARRHCGFGARTVLSALNDRQRTWIIMWLRDHVYNSELYQQAAERLEQEVTAA